MQTIKTYLYQNSINVLFLGDYSIPTEDFIVYSREIKLYQGVPNLVKLTCLNQDQKPVNITNYTITANIFNVGCNQVLLTTEATVNPNIQNIAEITLTSTALNNLELGYYEIALIATDQFGNVTTLYINTDFGVRLPIELLVGPVNGIEPAVDLIFTPNGNSGVISQTVDLTTRDTLSTVFSLQANLVAYSGNVIIQGAMISLPTPTDFGNLLITNYSNYSGPIMSSVTGSFAALTIILDTGNVLLPANTNINSAQLRF